MYEYLWYVWIPSVCMDTFGMHGYLQYAWLQYLYMGDTWRWITNVCKPRKAIELSIKVTEYLFSKRVTGSKYEHAISKPMKIAL